MPGMKGDELAARIREQLPTQRIIMATALVQDYTVFGRQRAVDALLLKPFTLQKLLNTGTRVMVQEPPDISDVMPPPDAETPFRRLIPPE